MTYWLQPLVAATPSQVCDENTGDCVCPPHTQGAICERCASNAWNYHPYKGCELCDCNGVGADGQECDSNTGQCKCKAGYVGHKCGQCEAGYFNFPDCEPCNCNMAGTEPTQCKDSTCLCSNEGQCKCKKHTTGLKCDQCSENSFSLESQNPNGCTECFCFNRSTSSCTQNSASWRQIYSPDRQVRFEEPFEYYTRRHNIHILRESPLNYNSYPTNHTPLYWPLPSSFLGDRTASYNGFIRFRIRNDDNYRGHPNVHPEPSTFRLFAQILLIGNNRIELEHIPVEIAEDGKYKLPVSRKQFMVTLQNLQAIYIRATYNHMFRGDTISLSELSLDVAISSPNNITEDLSSTSPAIGVELCSECSPGYTGDSCQNPIEGYCRKRDPNYLNNPDDLALVGWSAQCSCNGHSSTCDTETCTCNDCQHNTVGDFCEYCRPGYYGSAIEGGNPEETCRKCACPLLENSFSDTCRASPNPQGYVCDACKPGYTGQFCESCVSGYYGDPMAGGYCAVCGCHPFGSLHSAVCHPLTGQCPCREGVGGRDCSNCSPRHAFIGGLCTSCDGGCYKELMMIEDQMEHSLNSIQNFTDLKPIPRKRLNRISNTVHSLDEILNSIQSSETDAQQLLQNVGGTENRYLKQANVVEQEFSLLEERNNDSLAKLAALNNHLDGVRQLVHMKNRQVVDISSQLAELSHRAGGNHDQQPGDIQNLVMQAQQYLNTTRDRDQHLDKELNYAKNNAEKAERLLKDIFGKKLDDTTYQDLLEKQVQFKTNLKDYRDTLWDQAKSNSQAAKTTSQAAMQRVQVLEKTIADIQAFNETFMEKLHNSQQLVDSIQQTVNGIQDTYKEIDESLLPILREQRESLTDIGNDYAQIYSPDYRANEVQKAQKHAMDLEHDAGKLKGLFTATQAFSTDALAASNAYKDIILTMKNATAASNVAKSNAEDAFVVVDITSPDSLVNLAQTSLNKSNDISQKLEQALNELSINEATLNLQKSLAKVEAIQAEIDKNSTWIKDVQQLLDDHHDRINTVHSTVDDTQLGFGDIQERTDEFTNQVEDVKARADSIHGFDQQTIRETIGNVSQSTENIAEMEKSLDSVRARTDQHNNQIKAISKDIGVLKEKINEAREKASKIRIAVKSDVGNNCVREYISPVNPAPSNTITLKYRPAIDSPDSLLFLTATKGTRTQNREYIAVELKGKKIHVKWDIGDGRREAAIVKRNIVYIPASDRYTWYHIEIKRVANSMQVSVVQKQSLTGEGPKNVDEPTQVVVGEPDLSSHVIFNTLPGQTRIFMGHPDSQLTEQMGLTTNRFYGTLGEVTVDGVNVPLWVFDASYGNCDGSAGLSTPMASGHMFRDGFAQIRMPMNERANTMISVAFSAYSPSGLLYFRGSPATGDFISVSLEGGAVSLKAHLGGGAADSQTVKSIALLSTNSNYADGRAHKVRVIRKDGEVHLQVDTDEDHVSTALPDDTAALNIPEPDHYVGGVPPNFDISKFSSHQIPFEGFFGCVQSVRPNQVSELDLDNPVRSQRKEPGCAYSKEDRLSTPDRVIGFSTPGYLLSKSPIQLSTQSSSVSFNLRTRSSNAVLLYQAADIATQPKRLRRDGEEEQEDKTFLGFYLYNGRLIGHLGTDDQQRLKRPSLSSNHSYNDGLLHSVFLSRTDSLIQMRIDDKEVLTAKLEDETTIGTTHHYVLFGGFPTSMANQEHHLGTSEPLIGCLSDFQHNYENLPIILEEHQATLGSCEFNKKGLVGTEDEEYEPVDDQQPDEGHLKPNFDRKKSKQSLEAAEPTFSHHSQKPYLMSSIGRSRRRESTCGASPPDNLTATADGGYRFGVSESSHARVNFDKPYPDFANFNLSMSIKTSQKKGMLWVWASYKNFTRYFFLNIEKGFLVLEIKGHKQAKELQYKAKKVNDNQWHRVQLIKQEKQVSLQLDDHSPEYMRDAPNPR
uniref:Uncharacterized protein n=1 Tax=Ditylenchus dipsaci TaxID=166011 RepID=A0A915E106_9BILA